MMGALNAAPEAGRGKRWELQIVSPISKIVLATIAVLVAGVWAAALYLPGAMAAAAVETAYRNNLEIARLISTVRDYYSENVVAKATGVDALTASHLHEGRLQTIPLPATFVQDISDLMKQRAISFALVSPYPWPHRAARQMDDFEISAWAAFQQDPDRIFSRQELRDGQWALRIAVADRMTSETCTGCHNAYPDVAKRDWKVGDVRGVLEVTQSIDARLAASQQRSHTILIWIATGAFIVALALLAATIQVERRARERLRLNTELDHLAHHDALTGLPNRVVLRQRLDAALADATQGAALFFVDLDDFKDVNAAHGPVIGDQLLNAVAARLRSSVGENAIVARWGGDEFMILQTAVETRSVSTRLAERLVEAMRAPFEVDGQQISIGATVGITRAPQDGQTSDQLLQNADLAAYIAKRERSGTFRFFEPVMNLRRSKQRELESEFRHALATESFEVHYQPVVEIDSRRAIAMEALVRWRHPERGLIAPDLFISMAEDIGLIRPLGELVLRHACRDALRWPAYTKVAVNLSPVQFICSDLPGDIARILHETGLPANRLELEITESVLLNRSEDNISTLHRLRQLGISIALDDFGTGYSSLSYLRTFPFDKIKIDRSFVGEMSQLDSCAAIVCAVANLGRSLGMVTTAEGVETEEQLELLRAAGCTLAQGYLFGRPQLIANFGSDDFVATVRSQEQTSLTARDIMLVRRSFARVLPIQDAAADLFYNRLFTIAPRLRSLFPEDLAAQKSKLMQTLALGIGKLNDLPALLPTLKALGARHGSYGVALEDYAIVAQALLWALGQGLGEEFTPDVRSAWRKVYWLLASAMKAGQAESMAGKAA